MVFVSPSTWPSASPAEVRLVEDTLDERFFEDFPPRLIGDKVYDSDRLDHTLMTKRSIDAAPPFAPCDVKLLTKVWN